MKYTNIKKSIAMFENNINDVDYPDDVMKMKPWNFSYLDKLCEWSTNGARSPKAISHLKKVTKAIYGKIAAIGILVILGIIIVAIVVGKN